MNTKFRKWKFKPMNKVFISEKKLEKLFLKQKITIYDTRNSFDFKKKKLKKSINVTPTSIKRTIKKHDKKDKILLVGKDLRTNASIASWGCYEGYKHIYLLDKRINEVKNKKLI